MNLTEIAKQIENSLASKEVMEWLSKKELCANNFRSYRVAIPDESWMKNDCQQGGFGFHPSNSFIERTVLKDLQSLIKKNSSLNVFDKNLINTVNGGSSLSYNHLIGWMLENSKKNGIEATVQSLSDFVEKPTLQGYKVLIVTGVSTTSPIEIDSQTSIVPYKDIPRCLVTEKYQLFAGENPCKFWPGDGTTGGTIGVGIVIKKEVEPKIYAQDEKIINKDFSSDQNKLYSICRLLTLIGPSAPQPFVATEFLSEDTPCTNNMRSTYGFKMGGPLFADGFTLNEQGVVDLAQYKEIILQIIKDYNALDTKTVDHINIALTRLNKAIFPPFAVSLEDKVIDLGIALESILLSDVTKDELKYRFALRGALLTEATQEERTKVRKLLKNIYDYRSDAVHNGKVKLGENEVIIKEEIRSGFILCARIIRTTLSLSKLPDWSSIELGTLQPQTELEPVSSS